MDEPRDKPPGAVPQYMWPPQVTAPLPLPPPEPKTGHGWDAAKLIGVVLTIGTIVFSAGAANEKLKNLDAKQTAADEQREHRNRLRDDRDEKLKSAFDGLSAKVDDLAEQVKQQRRARPWRRRDNVRPSVDERP